ncbi:MAG: 50S ribosomal protein L29 [Deltaproteobacteria bacterium]|nr:50S ribosomal protein L29 [Deltaproteobacteria bacterium]
MKAKEVREFAVDELNQKEKDLKEEYFNLKFQLATNQLANTAQIKKVRHDIARVKSITKEKQLAE